METLNEMTDQPSLLQAKARELGPWRYDHQHGALKIAGDPSAAPIHGSLGRGADIMRHVLGRLGTWRDVSSMRAIDLGCLEGHYTEQLCAAGFRKVVAVDLSAEHVARARFLLQEVMGYTNVSVIEGSVEDRAFMQGLGHFDVILFHGLLYHMKDPIGIFETISRIASPDHVLLLSTQFKFEFAEIVVPSALANIKFRRLSEAATPLVHDSGVGSTYASMAVRLNPRALDRLLRQVGYRDLTAYDTPLGCRYGFHVHLIAATFDQTKLREALNRGHDIPNLKFFRWAGDRLDSFSLKDGWRSRFSRLVLRVAYAICERLGRSGARQSLRAEIAHLSD